jgi:hypothetical protein
MHSAIDGSAVDYDFDCDGILDGPCTETSFDADGRLLVQRVDGDCGGPDTLGLRRRDRRLHRGRPRPVEK